MNKSTKETPQDERAAKKKKQDRIVCAVAALVGLGVVWASFWVGVHSGKTQHPEDIAPSSSSESEKFVPPENGAYNIPQDENGDPTWSTMEPSEEDMKAALDSVLESSKVPIVTSAEATEEEEIAALAFLGVDKEALYEYAVQIGEVDGEDHVVGVFRVKPSQYEAVLGALESWANTKKLELAEELKVDASDPKNRGLLMNAASVFMFDQYYAAVICAPDFERVQAEILDGINRIAYSGENFDDVFNGAKDIKDEQEKQAAQGDSPVEPLANPDEPQETPESASTEE